MKIHNVKSKAVVKVAYSRKTSELSIQFKGNKSRTGGIYVFQGVGKDMFTKMRKADSVGRFVNKKVVGRYTSYQVQSLS